MPLTGTKRRVWKIASLAIIVLVIAAGVVWLRSALNDPLHSDARRQWASHAISTIDQRIKDDAWLESERSKLKSAATSKRYEGGWVGDELLVTQNGEWIVCENVCTKEQNTAVQKDIFIGRGSDGRWYYSTFHFCVGKCVLQIEAQPETLAELVDAFWFVPFDGHAENCLSETWTGGAYGQEKLQAAKASARP